MSVPVKTRPFLDSASQLAKLISNEKESLISLLQKYETFATAEDEIERSLECLGGFEKEFSKIDNPLTDLNVATFFPLNLPLYSLVLFGIAPSRFASNVYIRAPEVMQPILDEVWEFLNVGELFPNIQLKPTQRHAFMSMYAQDADVIIFTGKYENALAIHSQCPFSLLLYNGSGVNPFLVLKNADVKKAAAKAVEMRCFNSGQDCAGPDAFVVHKDVAEDFTKHLTQNLKNIKVGNTKDKSVDIGPTMRQVYIEEVVHWAEQHRASMVFGGEVDLKNNLVHPTVFRQKLSQHKGEFHEFFAPFFYVLEYSSDDELVELFKNSAFNERAMYVSVFGDNPNVTRHLDFVKVLHNKIVNDVERGNDEYGGWGPKANFLLYGDRKIVKPVLISRDIHEILS